MEGPPIKIKERAAAQGLVIKFNELGIDDVVFDEGTFRWDIAFLNAHAEQWPINHSNNPLDLSPTTGGNIDDLPSPPITSAEKSVIFADLFHARHKAVSITIFYQTHE